jgi:DNA-binding NarL/FixJ family response regulator
MFFFGDAHWKKSTGIPEITMPFVLSHRESAVIALLVQGHTDAVVAEHLRISDRSVTNVLRAIMDRLGVDNRFQLGLALGCLSAARAQTETKEVPPINLL